jgi:ureidoacrylate peracid hydrolase
MEPRTFPVNAQPAPAMIDADRAAIIVVDMQNDFGSGGGMFHRAGIDITGIQAVVPRIVRVIEAARNARIPIVYLKMEYGPDLSNAGAPSAPNWITHLKLGGIGAETDHGGRVLIRDTWNTAIVDDLAPEPGDLVVSKHRFSGFFETRLDAVLRERGISQLIFAGCTTSICVESTLRDAYFRDYHCLLLEDCCAEPIGAGLPRSNHDATVLLVEIMFGHVSTSDTFVGALSSINARLPV